MSSVLYACAMDDISCGGEIVTPSLTSMLFPFITAGYAVRVPFKFSIQIDGLSTGQTSIWIHIFLWPNIPLLEMLTMGYFKSRVRASM